MSELDKEFKFKITVIGDGGVGKTSLIQKFTNDSFTTDYIKTIGAQFSVFDKEIKDDNVKLLFWDIAGQDDFNFLRPAFFNDSRAAIVVYSLEDNDLGVDSFNHIESWVKDIYSYCGEIPVVVFGNKVDLIDEKQLDTSKIAELVKENEFLGYFITSAKTGEGVIEAFNAIIDILYLKYKDIPV
jgi:small GTP-binding protein